MSFRVIDAHGNERVFGQIEGLPTITRKAMRRCWYAFGKDLKAEASKEIMRRPKSGRVYLIRTKSGRLRRHVASKPGETHANFSGAMRRSLSWKVTGFDSLEFGFGVSTGPHDAPPHTRAIEFGRLDGLIEERRSARNAIDAVDSHLQHHYNQAFEAERRKA